MFSLFHKPLTRRQKCTNNTFEKVYGEIQGMLRTEEALVMNSLIKIYTILFNFT